MVKDNEIDSSRCFRRDGYIPAGYDVLLHDQRLQALAMIDPAEHAVVGFSGRRMRPDFHLRFPTRAHVDCFVQHWLGTLDEKMRAADARRQQCERMRNPLSEGDVLSAASGDPIEHIAYFEVTKCIGGCTVEIRELCRVEECTCCDTSGECAPVPGCYVGAPIRRRVSADGRVRIRRGGPWAERKAVHQIAGLRLFSADAWSVAPGRP